RIDAGHHVFFHAEVGNEKAMQDIRRTQNQFHRLSFGNDQLVGTAPAIGLLKLPEPLAAVDVDLHGVGRGLDHDFVVSPADVENSHDDDEKAHHDRGLQDGMPLDVWGQLRIAAAAVVSEEEVDDRADHRDEGAHAEIKGVVIEQVHAWGHGGGLGEVNGVDVSQHFNLSFSKLPSGVAGGFRIYASA